MQTASKTAADIADRFREILDEHDARQRLLRPVVILAAGFGVDLHAGQAVCAAEAKQLVSDAGWKVSSVSDFQGRYEVHTF